MLKESHLKKTRRRSTSHRGAVNIPPRELNRPLTLGARLQGFAAIIVAGVIVVSAVVQAGTLTPSATPAASSYTLGDIYTRLTTNASATAGDHSFSPSASPDATLYTLSEIYSAIPTIYATTVLSGVSYLGVSGTYDASSLATSTVKSGVSFGVSLTGAYPSASYPLPDASTTTTDLNASAAGITTSNGNVEWWQSSGTRVTAVLDFPTITNVCDSDTSNNSIGTLTITSSTVAVGNTYCGVAGSLLKDQFNGSLGAGGFNGGSQSSGGVEDSNNLGTPAASRYAKSWTACTSENNYCGTGDSGADMKDDSTGLVWSMPCNGSGCSSFSDSSPATYSWDSSGANNNSRTASQLCSDHSGWSLPHQKQLLQAYINGSYGNLEAVGTSRYHWSATTQSDTTSSAWRVSLTSALTTTTGKTTSSVTVRCVR